MEHSQQTLCQLGHVPNTRIYWATESNQFPPDITGVDPEWGEVVGIREPLPPPSPLLGETSKSNRYSYQLAAEVGNKW